MKFRALHAHVRGPIHACDPVTDEARVFEVVPSPDLPDIGQIGNLSPGWADYFRRCGDWRVEEDRDAPQDKAPAAPEGGQEGDGGGAPAGGRGAPPPESAENGAPAGQEGAPVADGAEVAADDADASARGRSGARKGR